MIRSDADQLDDALRMLVRGEKLLMRVNDGFNALLLGRKMTKKERVKLHAEIADFLAERRGYTLDRAMYDAALDETTK